MRRTVAGSCAALLLVAFLLFAWPTLYIYQSQGGRIVRINRVTQAVSLLGDSGWVSLEPLATASAD